jgi:putative PEP-CTERM system histidine kinase
MENSIDIWIGLGAVAIVAALAFLAVVLLSASFRARVKVSLTKAFSRYKYDYRSEWLRLISTLSESDFGNVGETSVRAVAQIVSSPGGNLWIWDPSHDCYVEKGSWRSELSNPPPIPKDSVLVKFLEKTQWVVDLEEMKRNPGLYSGLNIEDVVDGDWWLIVPIYLDKSLYGIVALLRPQFIASLNFEDHDLLRTVGRHVAMHVNQAEIDKRLSENSQFQAYNRLTAFLMHDLNNLVAQLSLVIKNAERHRKNPMFVDDAINTIANSTTRMRQLMRQLRSSSRPAQIQQVDLQEILRNVRENCKTRTPVPRLEACDFPVHVNADRERLSTVFEHLVRNGQDATPGDGELSIRMTAREGKVEVSIRDTGEGMTDDFIRDRLFKPFDSTKGSEGMGIGAYQAKEYIQSLGGEVKVSSEIGKGTEFTVRLDLSAKSSDAALAKSLR